MSIADYSTRQRAIDPRGSFAVSAPAGAGKTGLLTQRVLRLLSVVDEPEQILCMTFTKKAAAEMRQRVHHALMTANQPGSADSETIAESTDEYTLATQQLARQALERDCEKGWQLLKSPHRLQVHTIDGFCLNLVRQRAMESRLGHIPRPSDDVLADYQAVVDDILLPRLEGGDVLSAAIATLLRHQDNHVERLRNSLVDLLRQREQWLPFIFQLQGSNTRQVMEQQLTESIEEVLQHITHTLSAVIGELIPLINYAANNLRHTAPDHPLVIAAETTMALDPSSQSHAGEIDITEVQGDIQYLPLWKAVESLFRTQQGKWRSGSRGFTKTNGFPTEVDGDKSYAKQQKARMVALLDYVSTTPELDHWFDRIKQLPLPTFSQDQWQCIDALQQLLPVLAGYLNGHFQQTGHCDFTEITLAALRAFTVDEAPSELAMKLDYGIQHILTDEFQDTSSSQYALIEQLTAEWTPDDGRTLFIVGDAMQSLYGFRNANVGLFMQARQQPFGNITLEPLDLSVNFRSQRAILDWVNRAFPLILPADNEPNRGAVCYTPCVAHQSALNEPPVSLDVFVNHPDYTAQAAQVVSLVQSAKQRDPKGSIAILVRNRGHLKEILPALQHAGLRWQATNIDPLANRMPVTDLMSLTRALLYPNDRIAWLAIMRAPWCGLSNQDLLALCNGLQPQTTTDIEGYSNVEQLSDNNANDKHFSYKKPLIINQLKNIEEVQGLSPEGQLILQRVSKTLITALQYRQRQPLRCWVESTWQQLGGAAALQHQHAWEDCQQYLALLEQHETAGTLPDWAQFEAAIDKLFAGVDTEGDSKLQIMTIHKSKGLEFDTVIIPGLNRSGTKSDSPLLIWEERIGETGEAQLLVSPQPSASQDSDAIYDYLRQLREEKNQHETARVLYVGITRAIKRVHLLCNCKHEEKQDAWGRKKGSLFNSLWPAVEEQFIHRTSSDNSITWHDYQEPSLAAAILDSRDNSSPYNNQNPTANRNKHHIYRLPPDWSQSPLQQKNTANNDPDIIPVARIKPTLEDEVARHTGTILHRIMRQLTLEGISHWSQQRIDQQRDSWRVQLEQLGVMDTQLPLARLEKAVTQCLHSETAQWILDDAHQDSHCEYALCYIDPQDESKTRIIDRTFIDQDVRWVIDYKLAEPNPGQPSDTFLNQQRQRYQDQLQQYAGCLSQLDMTSSAIKQALFFPLINEIVIF